MLSVTCVQCASTFAYTPTRGPRRRYCSSICASRSAWSTRDKAKLYRTRTCVQCGTTWQARPRSRYCSKACQDAVRYPVTNRRKPMSERVKTARRKQRAAARTVRGTQRWTSGQCRICRAWFVSPHADITCSTACREQHKANRRRDIGHNYRARKVNAFVAKVYRQRVFEADGYRCHICHRLTDRTKRAPHPRAPTIDHLIPLAAHGKHEPVNCRTACFLCNCTKREVGTGDQLILFAS